MTPTEKRIETKTVNSYLLALDHKQRGGVGRGRRTREWMENRYAEIEQALTEVVGVQRLHLIQEQNNIRRDLDVYAEVDNFDEWEQQFIKVAASYGQRNGITWDTWRRVGVPAAVLNEAGVAR